MINNIATWNGTVWDTISTEGINNTVDAFAVIDSGLYAGGIFTRAGKVNAVDIAVWGNPSLGINSPRMVSNDVLVYPNPNRGQFTLQIKGVKLQGENIEIFNVLGEKVYSQFSIFNSQLSINLTSQPPGIYLYRIINASGAIAGQGKIAIQ